VCIVGGGQLIQRQTQLSTLGVLDLLQ
jgi:hypothetical protein